MTVEESSPRFIPLTDLLVDFAVPRLDWEAKFAGWRLGVTVKVCKACSEAGWVGGLAERVKITGYNAY